MMSRHSNAACLTAGLLMLGALGAGCGGAKEPEVALAPYPDGGYGVDGQVPPVAQADAGVQAAPPPQPPPSPVGPCDAVQSLAMTTMFQGRQKGEAPGMQPEGAPTCNVVTEGQSTSSATFMLQPGRCYTILAQALPNVTAIDLQLELDVAGTGAPPPLAALAGKPLLAVGQSNGVQSAIGATQAGCYQWPWPAPAPVKVTLTAKMGAGVVAAQVFSKKK